MKGLFQTTAIIGSSQLLVILLQIARAKLVALIIGPEGVGVLGNTIVLVSLLENVCFFGFHLALLRYASEEASQKNFAKTSELLSTTILIHMMLSTAGIIISLLFLRRINMNIYQSLSFLSISIFAILTIPFLILKSDFGNLFNAFNEVKLLGTINVTSAIIGLGVTVPLIYLWKLKGAILSVFVNAIIMFFIVFYFYMSRFRNKVEIKKELFSKTQALKMFKYGGANQLAIIINTIGAYLLRVFVTGKLLLTGAGIFNATMSLGSYLLMLQIPLGIYLYPKISSIYKNRQGTIIEINNILRFFLILLVPIIICMLLFSDIAIKLLLSDAFMDVKLILIWILLGKFFEILQGIITTPIFIMEKFKIYLTVISIFNFILVGSSYVLLKNFGLVGMAIAISLSYVLFFILWLFAALKTFGFKIESKNVILIATSIPLFILSNYLSNYSLIIRIIMLLFVAFWLLIVVKKEEWQTLFEYLKSASRRISTNAGTNNEK